MNNEQIDHEELIAARMVVAVARDAVNRPGDGATEALKASLFLYDRLMELAAKPESERRAEGADGRHD